MVFELLVCSVMVAMYSCILQGADHAFRLAVGPGMLWFREAMLSAAQRAPAKSPRLQEFFGRIARQHGKKTTRVALARKMLMIAYYLLLRNEPYQERQRG
jgi:hypothetical protein